MHIAKTNYWTVLLRISFRDGKKIRKVFLCNLSSWGHTRLASLETALRWWRLMPNLDTANGVLEKFDDFDFNRHSRLSFMLVKYLMSDKQGFTPPV